MTARYRFDPGRSRFTVQAFATGMLSFLGHSPTFAVADFSGSLSFPGGTLLGLRLELIVMADSLTLLDNVSPADRAEIEGRMRREVLETAAYPEIRFVSEDVTGQTLAPGRSRVRIGGPLTLHGVIRPQVLDAGLTVYDDGIRLAGGSVLRPSEFGIRPVVALGGAIRLKDELRLAFDLAAIPEGE
jgi:polyisoprenoid-binding protein YceI